MREYVKILERETEMGDLLSKKILNNFDHKLMSIIEMSQVENI